MTPSLVPEWLSHGSGFGGAGETRDRRVNRPTPPDPLLALSLDEERESAETLAALSITILAGVEKGDIP